MKHNKTAHSSSKPAGLYYLTIRSKMLFQNDVQNLSRILREDFIYVRNWMKIIIQKEPIKT